jgi:GT2 family glycosyltransferase
MRARVAVIVLTWNQRDLTLGCLHSLSEVEYPPASLNIILVDNGSTDGTTQAVRQQYPEVQILEPGENLGFAEANNLGMRHALAQRPDYLLLLNNDTIVDPLFLTELIRVAEADPHVGIVGPKMYYYDQPDVIWCAGNAILWSTGRTVRLQAEQRDLEARNGSPYPVDFVTACAVAVKRQVVDEIGLLDPRFFIYYEEVDWCLRAAAHGYRAMVAPASRIWHKVSAAMGATSPATDYYMNRNVFLFLAKHRHGWAGSRSLLQTACQQLLAIAAYTAQPHGGRRLPHRNARLLALRDAALGRWGKMGPDVALICRQDRA